MSKKAYLAAPFFNPTERMYYEKIIAYLRKIEGFDLYVPMEHTIPNAYELENYRWAYEVFKEDVAAIDEAEYVFVVNYGMYSDSGTAWEMGYAYAKGKKVVNILCAAENRYSLMTINGCNGGLFNESFEEVLLEDISQY